MGFNFSFCAESIDAGHFYLYKDVLPIGFLGLVDDIVGVTLAGHKAAQLNAVINVKTAEKTLQFGASKCKSMLIGKDTENVLNNEQLVDNWKVSYECNESSGEVDLIETYEGKVKIEKTDEYKYLGFVISNKGNSMANIHQVKNKAIGVVKRITSGLLFS